MSIRGLWNKIIVDILKIFCYNYNGRIYLYKWRKQVDSLKKIQYNIIKNK